ncbi:MAG: hypothetical protein K9N46_09760 [Candidatus Marinimicrobia bacterium]|nr:hypothetical protein [Candidatus Neomarinimicrobiota bacterium]MCF7828396.1 hypothetical protein [Candidatus Neomarinimicrobiota bacterium]MCF7881010.1 hypothetical protein [Candidatus Neomarinimicrobiota bacterium]
MKVKGLYSLITYVVVSHDGVREFEEKLSSAIVNISQIVKTQDKWIYLDGKHVQIEDLHVDVLESASFILLSDALIGGLPSDSSEISQYYTVDRLQ